MTYGGRSPVAPVANGNMGGRKGALDPDILMRVNRDDEVSELKLALHHARHKIRQLEAQLACQPLLFRLQNQEQRARQDILVQWAKHQEGVESAKDHLVSATSIDQAVVYERRFGPVMSPGRPTQTDPAPLKDIRGSLNQAMMDRCKAMLALFDELG